jgi:hypothetical protein
LPDAVSHAFFVIPMDTYPETPASRNCSPIDVHDCGCVSQPDFPKALGRHWAAWTSGSTKLRRRRIHIPHDKRKTTCRVSRTTQTRFQCHGWKVAHRARQCCESSPRLPWPEAVSGSDALLLFGSCLDILQDRAASADEPTTPYLARVPSLSTLHRRVDSS